MGISHFSGLFVLLCVGVGGALLTLAGEHGFYQLILPHIRRRQNLKYWLHTSQKIHRALNMTYEDVKRQRAEREKSCNLEKSPPPLGPPEDPGESPKWNNDATKEAAAAAVKDARDFRRVHFNLETLNTRRLLARIAASDAKGGGAKSEGHGPARPRAGPNSKLCENGGPPISLARIMFSPPSSSSSSASSPAQPNTSAPPPASVAPPCVAVAPPPVSVPPPPAAVAPPPAAVAPPPTAVAPPPAAMAPPPTAAAPPQPGELQELQEQIDQMREKLRMALARRAQIQTTLTKPVNTVTNNPSPDTTTTITTTAGAPPSSTPVTTFPANTKCVTTMTDPPHKVLSKVRPLHSRLTSQRR